MGQKLQLNSLKKNKLGIFLVLLLICFTIQFSSCSKNDFDKTYFKNGNLKSHIVRNEFGTIVKKLEYYSTGEDSVHIIYYSPDTSMAQVQVFEKSGTLAFAGSQRYGKWFGAQSTYNERGFLEEINQRISIDWKSTQNQNWIFDSTGYIIGGNHFDLISISDDTLTQGEDYTFSVHLHNPRLTEEFEFIDGYDNKFDQLIYEPTSTMFYTGHQLFNYKMIDTGQVSLNFKIIQRQKDQLNSNETEISESTLFGHQEVYIKSK